MLSCKTPQKVAHFIIYKVDENKFSFDKKHKFDSVKQLISYYTTNPLIDNTKLVERIEDYDYI